MTTPSQSSQAPGTAGHLIKFATLGLLLVAMLTGARWYQQQWAPQTGVIHHDCDLQRGICQIELNNGRLQLEAGPLPMRSLSPLRLTLRADGIEATSILADLQGKDMYMGVNQFELTPSAESLWHGQTELAVCTTGSMQWQLTLTIATPDTTQQHVFEFEAR
ncbi:hypothetical protein [Marinobacterium marinum]|uniref:Uncharacterized protein n=1 Tax=Marinobacterium marinum TaxID=2756129 RepID=A0A7W1WVY9_9GAMM|nr:hypothetical protein [Marinobacterium marinum]MBA4501182.1 hypothetical protein [Marinobacterium marinum]